MRRHILLRFGFIANSQTGCMHMVRFSGTGLLSLCPVRGSCQTECLRMPNRYDLRAEQ